MLIDTRWSLYLRQNLQAEVGISTEKQWKSPKKGQRLYVEKENDKITLMHDPYAVAWKMISQGKLIPETVGHVPKELSRATWFFLMQGGKICGSVFEEKYRPSPIPKGGLKIMLRD